MYKTFVKITLITMLLTPLFSQVSSGGDPKSIQAGITGDIPQVIMPLVDSDALLKEDEIRDVLCHFNFIFLW